MSTNDINQNETHILTESPTFTKKQNEEMQSILHRIHSFIIRETAKLTDDNEQKNEFIFHSYGQLLLNLIGNHLMLTESAAIQNAHVFHETVIDWLNANKSEQLH